MNWKLIVWEVVSWAVLLLSLWKLRRELPHPPVKRCDECGWCRPIPEEAAKMFREGEMDCQLGRGLDILSDDGHRVTSVVWDDSYCSDYVPVRKVGRR